MSERVRSILRRNLKLPASFEDVADMLRVGISRRFTSCVGANPPVSVAAIPIQEVVFSTKRLGLDFLSLDVHESIPVDLLG